MFTIWELPCSMILTPLQAKNKVSALATQKAELEAERNELSAKYQQRSR
jgi:hypothetical protein